jgi:sulfite reductase beta subunit-like hemoprotein
MSSSREQHEADYDRTVRTEIELFRTRANELLSGAITDDDFRGFRLRYGIYGQRQPGVQMVRTKFPGGVLTAPQMRQLARISDEYAGGRGHVTTRQNMQFHFVALNRAADVMHLLADEGMTTREACFNTVRNVTASPDSGLRRDEVFDVLPYARTVSFAFLRQALTDSMPRKFKIAFDGGSSLDAHADRMLGGIHDVGLLARIVDGKRGFRVVMGGGLGPLPTEAQVLDEFLPAERLVNRIEAVLRVFNKHGNRKNRNKARLKFVLRERGFEWLKENIEIEYADVIANGGIPTPAEVPEGFGGFTSQPRPLGSGDLLPVLGSRKAHDARYDRWLETNVEEQKQTGYAMIRVRIDQGNLSSEQMRGLAKIAETAGDGLLRITIDQNILLGYIPLAQLPRLYAALDAIGLGEASAGEFEDITTCPGAYSCNLALTKSMNLGKAIHDVVRDYDQPEARALHVKISGCPNSCGQHWIADFGFYGNARKIEGREVPYYQMLLGGGHDEHGDLRFGLAIQSIPARLAPTAVQRVLDHYLENRAPEEKFRQYVLRHKIEFFRAMTADLAKPPELFPEIYNDWGDETAFSLQLGRGECAA